MTHRKMKYQWGSGLVLMACAFAAHAATDCKPAKEGERPSHRVHWTTRSEIQSEGFEVFRSERVDGDFVKINDAPIPAAKNSVRPREYEYSDYAIDPCKVYFYYVEAVAIGGYRVKLTEPRQAGPKTQ